MLRLTTSSNLKNIWRKSCRINITRTRWKHNKISRSERTLIIRAVASQPWASRTCLPVHSCCKIMYLIESSGRSRRRRGKLLQGPNINIKVYNLCWWPKDSRQIVKFIGTLRSFQIYCSLLKKHQLLMWVGMSQIKWNSLSPYKVNPNCLTVVNKRSQMGLLMKLTTIGTILLGLHSQKLIHLLIWIRVINL